VSMALPIGLFDSLNPGMLIFLGVIAILLFGEHLPDQFKTWGKKFAEFRKSLQSIQDEIRSVAHSATSELTSAMDINVPGVSSSSTASSSTDSSNGSKPRRSRQSDEDYDEATAPKFVPPPRDPDSAV
jgi:Sec-independent protein translocase protein TatA